MAAIMTVADTARRHGHRASDLFLKLLPTNLSFAVRNRSIFSEPAGPVRERLIAILAG